MDIFFGFDWVRMGPGAGGGAHGVTRPTVFVRLVHFVHTFIVFWRSAARLTGCARAIDDRSLYLYMEARIDFGRIFFSLLLKKWRMSLIINGIEIAYFLFLKSDLRRTNGYETGSIGSETADADLWRGWRVRHSDRQSMLLEAIS